MSPVTISAISLFNFGLQLWGRKGALGSKGWRAAERVLDAVARISQLGCYAALIESGVFARG